MIQQNEFSESSELTPPQHPEQQAPARQQSATRRQSAARRRQTSQRLSEHYRALLRQLQNGLGFGGSRIGAIGVTSPQSGDGASTVACNLALVAAEQMQLRTVLVDAHFAHPSLGQWLGESEPTGLAEMLLKGQPLEACMRNTAQDHLSLLTAGATAREVSLQSDFEPLESALETLRDETDLIVVDLGPADELTPSSVVARMLDGVLLIAETRRNNQRSLHRAKAVLERANANILGIVLNKG